jgi:redox-sensitive bicupin YhaK (pirin superfamily)
MGATLSAGETLTYEVDAGRHAYLVPATGSIEIDGVPADARDGVALSGGNYTIRALVDAEIVLVDAA